MKPITVTVNADISGDATTRMVRLDNLRCGARAALACKTSGALGNGTFSIEYSFDDPNDLINPVPVNQMTWLTDMSPAINQNAGVSGMLPVGAVYVRCHLHGTQGSVTMTINQYRHGSVM